MLAKIAKHFAPDDKVVPMPARMRDVLAGVDNTRSAHRDLDGSTITIEAPEPPRERTLSELEAALRTAIWQINSHDHDTAAAAKKAADTRTELETTLRAITAEIRRRLIDAGMPAGDLP